MFAVVQQDGVVFAPRTRIGLFLAIFPAASTAARIAQIARECRQRYGLGGRPLATSRFHISLHHMGEFDEIPARVIGAVSKTAAMVRIRPFAVMLDRVSSFAGGERRYPLVLQGDDGVAGVAMLRQGLSVALQEIGLKPCRHFTPHLTLLYGDRRIEDRPIEPVCWTVREFALVLSLIGQTKYVLQSRWSLRG
jgi:RNA 2',3'-cyclic 3'-phosphodiesterase